MCFSLKYVKNAIYLWTHLPWSAELLTFFDFFFVFAHRFSVSDICPGLALCGALSIYTDKETVARLQPTCLINCAEELPDTPLPDTVHRYLKVPVADTTLTDLRPHMDMVADLIHQVKNRSKTRISVFTPNITIYSILSIKTRTKKNQ